MSKVLLVGFSSDANGVLDSTIEISQNFGTGEVSAVALLLALCNTEQGKKMLSNFKDVDYDVIEAEFTLMISEGMFGYLPDDKQLALSDLSSLAFAIVTAAGHIAASENRYVTVEDLIEITIQSMIWESGKDDVINELYMLNKDLELNIQDWKCAYEEAAEELNSNSLYIPDELCEYVKDLTNSDEIADMKISNVDKYIDDCIEILSRYRAANPCLIGSAGVGKTSIVYGLVQRIIKGEVPENLKNAHICYINGATVSAGTKYRGQFEQRMNLLFDWASDKNNNIILFLDEIHTFINAGSSVEDANTAGNMIKKYLSDGTIKLIGTTTTEEYHKFIEVDSAFSRRLQVVEVKEPSVNEAITMIDSSIDEYEKFHNVHFDRSLIELTVKATNTYMKNRALPDKAYAVIDQACAKTKISGKRNVQEKTVLDIISKNTGVNIKEMGKRESTALVSMGTRLKKHIIGQDKAVDIVTKAIKRSKSGVRDTNKPIASFLFVGPTGVGKTELCKQLCTELALPKEAFIRIDMSEYTEGNSISKLIGSAPGYVGYSSGGQLTEKIKHNAYSLILLDEIEKAHPKVFNIFLQLLDDGRLTDGQGNTVDCTNCIVVMTSNAGYSNVKVPVVGFGVSNNNQSEVSKKAIEEIFRPELLNRLDAIVEFNALSKNDCKQIVHLELLALANRVFENKQIKLRFNGSVEDEVLEKGFSEKYGARNIKREVQSIVQDALSDMILSRELNSNMEYTIGFSDDKLCAIASMKKVIKDNKNESVGA